MRANNALIKKYGNSFLKREVDYVTNFQHEYSNFYDLSKIHKSKIISKAIEEQGSEYILCFQPKDLKLCPIVASHKSLTKRLSKFVDILLIPLLPKIKSYAKDDFDFLKKCKRSLTKNSNLVSFDATSLYTNMPQELGLKVIEYWLDYYHELIHSRFNKSFILKAIKLFLKNNHFVFNKKFFHQIAETAMGTIAAPTYATLVMGYLELQFYQKCKNKFCVNNGKYIEENWYMFLDDCYIALDATNINPLKPFDILNNIHDNIKFTMEQHNLYLPFLDVMINKDPENNNI